MYPNMAEDLFSKKNPKSQKICRIPFSKWYEKPSNVKKRIIFKGIVFNISINNKKYTSPNVMQRRPETKIIKEKFRAKPVTL